MNARTIPEKHFMLFGQLTMPEFEKGNEAIYINADNDPDYGHGLIPKQDDSIIGKSEPKFFDRGLFLLASIASGYLAFELMVLLATRNV